MSVIAGLIRFSGEPQQQQDLTLACTRLDGPGLARPTFWQQGPAVMLARQRIITNEDMFERQPWLGAGGQLVLVYDGRLDNREEVAAALGISLKDEVIADGRLLLAAFERWGEGALPRLIGDFALALWDVPSRRLLLARDQLGRRTLYFHQGAGFVAFATTFPALLALPGVPKKINELGIADFLILNTHHPVDTFYQGLRRVPAATAAVFERGELKLNRYWSPEPSSILQLSSDEEYVEAGREQLTRAVACRLRSKDNIASTMTGGLDSSAVAATAASLLGQSRLFTSTSVPPEGLPIPHSDSKAWYDDESEYVRAIAAMYPNMDVNLASSLDPHWIESDPTRFFELGGVPARNVTNLGWLLPGYQQIRDAGISVLLTGEGGNPAWSYDGIRSFNGWFKRGRWLHLARELYLTGRARPDGRTHYDLLRKQVIKPLIPLGLRKIHKRLTTGAPELWTIYSAINPKYAADIALGQRSQQAGHSPRLSGPADPQEQRLHMLNRFEHGRDIATSLRALTGVETRSPLLDIRLLNFCMSMPEEQFLKDGVSRRLPRRVMAGRLPPAVLNNNLIGSQNPELWRRMTALRGSLLQEIAELQRHPQVARMIDMPRLVKITQDWSNETQVTLVLPRALHVARFLRWAENGL